MHRASCVLAPSLWRAVRPRLGRFSPFVLYHCAETRVSHRNVHTVPNLRHDIDEGIGDFLSPKALRLLAVEYQGGLLSRLNDLAKDTQCENMSILQTIISTSQDPNQTLAFNMASQAMNNSFFLDQLRPPSKHDPLPNYEHLIGGRLHTDIGKNFGSLSLLKSNLSAAAMGMVSSGWIWLVTDLQKNLAIIPTYGAGTVLVRAREQKTPRTGAIIGDSRRPSSLAYSPFFESPTSLNRIKTSPRSASNNKKPTAPGEVRSLGSYSGNLAHVGYSINPLFCVSLNEHAWMMDYGLWGKEEYLNRFWNVLDWERVTQTYEHWNPSNLDGIEIS